MVRKFSEKRSSKYNYVEIGYMIIKKKNLFKEYKNINCNLSEILRDLTKKRQVFAYKCIGTYYSISDKKRLLVTEKYLKPKKIILIDRDGVINFKAKKARYINFWSEFFFIPRVYKSLKKLSNAKMINLIGSQIEPYRQNIKLKDNEFFFDYLKKEIKDKRKMGHVTTLIK